MIPGRNREEYIDMSYQQAIADLDAQWAAGDMDAGEYELELRAIRYAHGEQQSARDEQEGVAA